MKLNQKLIKKNFELILKNYNLLEKRAKSLLSLRKIESFQPSTFNKLGYQTEITSFGELWKYIDTMQELRLDVNLRYGLNNFLSKEEFSVTEEILFFFEKFTKCLRKKTLPLNTLSRSLLSLRFIKQNFKKNINILELGPGSGLLGILLLKNNFNYDSFDVSKSFHIYQKILFKNFLNFSRIKKKTANLYWWSVLEQPEILKKYDLIIANHMLNEMHPNALKYILSNLNINSIIYFEGAGYNLDGDQESFLKIAEEKFFKLTYYRNLKKNDIYFGVLQISNLSLKPFPKFKKNIFIFIVNLLNYFFQIRLSSYFSILNGRDFGNKFKFSKLEGINFINNFKKVYVKKINLIDDDKFLQN